MFELDRENLTKTREGYLFVYAQIVFNQLRRSANLEDSHNHEPTGWRKYTVRFEREAEFLECKIVAALTTALFLEAYVFDYCARKESAT
jgi:hypothetical protein